MKAAAGSWNSAGKVKSRRRMRQGHLLAGPVQMLFDWVDGNGCAPGSRWTPSRIPAVRGIAFSNCNPIYWSIRMRLVTSAGKRNATGPN